MRPRKGQSRLCVNNDAAVLFITTFRKVNDVITEPPMNGELLIAPDRSGQKFVFFDIYIYIYIYIYIL